MSSLHPRLNHQDEGPCPATIRNNDSRISLTQASVTSSHGVPCPYEDKVVPNGTTARMVLMFLRGIVEQPAQLQQSYVCPMMKCHRTFSSQLPLVQHLLSCPEISYGVFDCEKCNDYHQFPTTEKEWAQWTTWKSQPAPFERKRSLGSKMRDTFTFGRKEPARRANASPEPQIEHGFFHSMRPGTAASQRRAMGGCPEHHAVPFMGQGSLAGFPNTQKPLVCVGNPGADRGMFWQGFGSDDTAELQSLVSSIAPSTTLCTNPSQTVTANTSQTTLFTAPRFPSYQAPNTANQGTPQQYMFPTSTYDAHRLSLSAMSLDEPLDSALPSGELRSPTASNHHTWWGVKPGTETQCPTPVSSGANVGFQIQSPVSGMLPVENMPGDLPTPTSPCTSSGMEEGHPSPYYPVQQTQIQHQMSRAISHDRMQVGAPGFYQMPMPDGNPLGAMSPPGNHEGHTHRDHHDHHGLLGHRKAGLESPTEDLVCEECQWKPRGVRENLKGYLRKHKNTHKGLRLPCDEPGCNKTFSRLDNLKKHRKEKHDIDEVGSVPPPDRLAEDYVEHIENNGAEQRRPDTSDSRIRAAVAAADDYSMLWPALHF
ncbi:hypothetical protein B0T19DRAFT_13853 [Cercophora scortea]|uniref:C2H2-type domain-containing protein n=1 Tax=Cercophora scortea TaxID=314031 RepID=A0AAE0J2A9_9PEZI|nr:hypothetical protein B0T19DRAFT_13853 [Cercophora scortea]